MSRALKLLRGNGEAGTRAAPAQTGRHDAEIGVRIDWGDKFTRDVIEYRRLKLQANKQAANTTINALAAKDSHAILAEADLQIDPQPENGDEAIDGIFEDLGIDMDKKAGI